MLRPVAFLSIFLAAASFGFAQSQSNDQGSSQPKPADGQAQSSIPANSQAPAQAKPQANDPSVFVLKGPERPPDQPQFTPELRAVDLEKRPALSASTKVRLIQLMQAEFAHVRHYFPLGDKAMAIDPQGRVTPNDAVLFQEVQQKGVAALEELQRRFSAATGGQESQANRSAREAIETYLQKAKSGDPEDTDKAVRIYADFVHKQHQLAVKHAQQKNSATP